MQQLGSILGRRAILVGSVLLATPAVAQRGRPVVGQVASLRGSASARFAAEAPRTLSVPDPVRLDDLLTTGYTSRLSVQVTGGFGLQLGERASVRLDRHVLSGAETGTALRLAGGPILFDIPPDAPGPVAVVYEEVRLGLRGARIFLGPLEGRLSVFVARGSVTLDAGNTRIELTEGVGADVNEAGGAPTRVMRWIPARIGRAMTLVE